MTKARFADKTVLITGAGTGMGRAAALRLAAEGARLALLGRRAEPLRELAATLAGEGGEAIALPCDITQEDAVAAAVDESIVRFGRLDGLFANAGELGTFKPMRQTTGRDFDDLIATNLKGTFFVVRQCLPHLDGGAILINASWTAAGVMPMIGAYASTKGALLSLMRTLAVEEGARGIRVNAINPGIIFTRMAEENLDAAFAARLAAHTPLGRNGRPEDIAGTVAWLLSEDAAFVTGQEITIDGGFTLGGIRL
ncbi:SDR family NAD(P)-dependent oxidoreductase [Segnochrobactrum spirostomi]|uniref:SDR family oxidoreductase n=1 Tax=Segnochrobactrum spirostomi TaxID=2608987 RepID=A0A6A7YBR4_9HYPH|nr:SDR family oxidoreductase [Segnochrobactrum spirostomi]MQT14859.1 SDR family oxidoreductase [Segnochrobactrum spirostomi]